MRRLMEWDYHSRNTERYFQNALITGVIIVHDPEAFLRQEVESATPAKLRFLLLRKANGLCHVIVDLWNEGKEAEGKQWLLLVREILIELLAGITDKTNEASKPIADLYIFLLRMAIELDLNPDVNRLQSLAEILQIEMETWDMFVRKENSTQGQPHGVPFPMGLDIGSPSMSLDIAG